MNGTTEYFKSNMLNEKSLVMIDRSKCRNVLLPSFEIYEPFLLVIKQDYSFDN